MFPAPEVSSQVWIVCPSVKLFQQESGIRSTRKDGLKNGLKSLGCRWIPVTSGGLKKMESYIFQSLTDILGCLWHRG
jgi:hypothetical protein